MENGRTKSGIKNIAASVINQIITLLLSFVSRSVFIHYLGASYLGMNTLFTDVLGILSMADLGFNTAMVYSFYKPLAERNYKKMAALTSFYKKVYSIIAISVAALGMLITPIIPYIINLDTEIDHLYLYYWISLARVVFSYVCVSKTCIFTSDQKNYEIVKITTVVNVIATLIQILVLVMFSNYMLYLSVSVFNSLAINIIASSKATKEYPFIKEKEQLDEVEKNTIFKNISSSFIYKLSSILLNYTDNILISVMFGTVTVGYYSNYLLIQNKISLLYSLVFTSLTASIGNLIVKENKRKRYEIFASEQTVSFIISLIVIPCYVGLVDEFVLIWLGNRFLLDQSMTMAIGLNMYLSCVLQPLWSYREATGLYRKTKWIMVVCAGLNVILSIILGALIGVSGIIWASSLSRILTYVWYEPRALFKEFFSLSSTNYMKSLMKNTVLVVILSVVSCLYKRNEPSLVYWLTKAIIIGSICTMTAYVVYRNSDEALLLKKIAVSLRKTK